MQVLQYFVISVYQVVVKKEDEKNEEKESTTIKETLVNHQYPPIGHTSSQLHNQTLLSFSYHGLDRFSDDTDQEWYERNYSMSDFLSPIHSI